MGFCNGSYNVIMGYLLEVHRGKIGIVEKKMETTMMGLYTQDSQGMSSGKGSVRDNLFNTDYFRESFPYSHGA